MSKSKKENEKVYYKLHDDLIAAVREALQLSLITGTNIVDHMRAMVVEPSEDGRYILPSPEYVEAWNKMICQLNEEAEEKMKEMDLTLSKTNPEKTN